MIAEFPRIKPLELSDIPAIRGLTDGFLPFSDFDVNCLWSWGKSGRTGVSKLNNNLVLRLFDYQERNAFYTFIGRSQPNDTAAALIRDARAQGLLPALHLVPVPVAQSLDLSTFEVVEDIDQSDYILLVQEIKNYAGQKYASKRSDVRRFMRSSIDIQFAASAMSPSSWLYSPCLELFRRWAFRRSDLRPSDLAREYDAFIRCCELPRATGLVGAGVFVGGELKAFSVSSLRGEYAITHFEKAESWAHPGILAYLNQRLADYLDQRCVRFINIEQDLGLEGLRKSKSSYGPCEKLRKYSISLRSADQAALADDTSCGQLLAV